MSDPLIDTVFRPTTASPTLASAPPVRVTGTRTRAGNAMPRTRTALLAGAARAVEMSGTKIAMAQVAVSAGVAKATLYNHFRTRDAVLNALVVDQVDALVQAQAGKPLEQALTDAAIAIGANPVRSALWRVEPAALATLSRIDDSAPGWRCARVGVELALGAADRGGSETVLRWLASFLLSPGDPATIAADVAVLVAGLPAGAPAHDADTDSDAHSDGLSAVQRSAPRPASHPALGLTGRATRVVFRHRHGHAADDDPAAAIRSMISTITSARDTTGRNAAAALVNQSHVGRALVVQRAELARSLDDVDAALAAAQRVADDARVTDGIEAAAPYEQHVAGLRTQREALALAAAQIDELSDVSDEHVARARQLLITSRRDLDAALHEQLRLLIAVERLERGPCDCGRTRPAQSRRARALTGNVLGIALTEPGAPPFEQIRTQLCARIADGSLAVGTRLPPVRALAASLGVAANTVARAYRELESAGLVETAGRGGTTVAAGTDRARARVAQAAQRYAATAREAGLSPDEAVRAVRAAIEASRPG